MTYGISVLGLAPTDFGTPPVPHGRWARPLVRERTVPYAPWGESVVRERSVPYEPAGRRIRERSVLYEPGGASRAPELPHSTREDEPPHLVAGRCLIALNALGRASARLTDAGAGLLQTLQGRRVHRAWGFPDFTDFAREVLQLSPRTTRRRLTLARTFATSPPLRDAFLDGRLSACKALVLRPLAGDAALPDWIDEAAPLSVRDLESRVRTFCQREAEAATGATALDQPGVTICATPATAETGAASDAISAATGQASAAIDATSAATERGVTITFAAPHPAALVWDQAIESARKLLGFQAPPHLCVEAILGEAGADFVAQPREADAAPFLADGPVRPDSADAPAPPDQPAKTDPPGPSPRAATAASTPESATLANSPSSPRPVRLTRESRQRIRQTLARVATGLDRLESLCVDTFADAGTALGGSSLGDSRAGDGSPSNAAANASVWGDGLPSATDPNTSAADAVLSRLRELERHQRELHLLRAHLLREMCRGRLHRALGFDTLLDFTESALGLSERTARALIAQAFLFRDEPLLAQAYRDGRIGRGQAWLVHRVMLTDTLAHHIRRATEVTHLQLEREVHFLERLREFAPRLWLRFPRPFPQPGLEDALLDELVARGATRNEVLQDLASRGLEISGANEDPVAGPPSLQDDHAPLLVDPDPAANPLVLRRLHVLLDMLVLAAYSDQVEDSTTAASSAERARSGVAQPRDDRQTLALRRWAGHTPGWTTISFWAPDSIHEAWQASLAQLRKRWGPLPTWAGAILIIEHALDVWEKQDPTCRPTEARILERDGYACQAPGCSARRRLEVHHIVFRSRGGTDHPWNKVTLCHAHHHHAIHEGTARLSGQAPDGLRWELGCERGKPPRWTLRGSRIIRR